MLVKIFILLLGAALALTIGSDGQQTPERVSCGNHHASSCALCPIVGSSVRQFNRGSSWCNGDCQWRHNQCTGADTEKPEARPENPDKIKQDADSIILVIGGQGSGYDQKDTVELLSFESGIESRRLSNFPKKMQNAVGTTLDDTPHICGGEDDDYHEIQECWAYNSRSDSWTKSGSMQEKKYGSAAAAHPSHGWVITGGIGGNDLGAKTLSSAESTKDGRNFRGFTQLPLGLSGHCLVPLEGGESGDFLLTGGDREMRNDYNKQTFLYKEGEWRKVEDMPTARRGLTCGTVRSRPGGPVEQVIAAGGFVTVLTDDESIETYLPTVEIYDVKSNTWRKGTDLPVPLEYAAVVPYGTTFLIIGGNIDTGYSDKVYQYTTDGKWKETSMKLSEAKSSVTAMIVPSSLFD